MEQAVFVWQDFNKSSELNYCLYFSPINLSYFRNRYNFLHPVERSSNSFLIFAKDIYIPVSVFLFNNYGGTCLTLNLLNDFSSGTNQSTNHIFRYGQHFNSWSVRFEFRSWLGNYFLHNIKNMHSSGFGLFKSFCQNFK